LQEETGVTSIDLLARTDGWIAYDFPKDYGGSKQARGYLGQKQVWFAYRFTGEESEIDLAAHEVEFDAWRWGRLDEACDLIVPFKRPAYEKVVAAFSVFAA
ncbi:MAG: RNA pyrophosphohydrolase, partial [Brevundimonas sp.]